LESLSSEACQARIKKHIDTKQTVKELSIKHTEQTPKDRQSKAALGVGAPGSILQQPRRKETEIRTRCRDLAIE